MQISNDYYTLIDKNKRFIVKVKLTYNRLFPLKGQHRELSHLSSFIPNDNYVTCALDMITFLD